jgi:diguanylate cyclase (GGDEF)-like protein
MRKVMNPTDAQAIGGSAADNADLAAMVVLVADDDPDLLEFVATLLTRDGYTVLRASDGREALELARQRLPDLLVLDVSMPFLDGYGVCREIQALGPDAPPVIFLTARAETQDRIVGLDAGAVDYVVKPFSGAELRARVRAALRTKLASDRLRVEASTDPLTGLANRQHLGPKISELVSAARRYDRPLACLMIDLDHFKAVNDTYGHPAGDAVLAEVAHRLQRAMRASDTLIRYGGEEFLILAPETDAEGAVTLGEKLCDAVSEKPIVYGSADTSVEISLRASIGAAVLDDGMYDGALLVAAADRALYEAKEQGRDRVVLAGAS